MTNPSNESLSFRDLVEVGARYVWPLIVCWNVFLYHQTVDLKDASFAFQLKVAKEYTSKADLEKMFKDLETRLDKRFELLTQSMITQRSYNHE